MGIAKSQFYPFVSGIMGIEFFRFRPLVSIAIGKYFAILHPCFRYNGNFFKNANFRPFPIFRTCCGTIYFAAEKRKNHSQSGFSDCPWSFPICYDVCVFALYFRYNGNYDWKFFTVLFPIEIGKFFLKLLFFKSPVSEKCPCFRLKWELTIDKLFPTPRQWPFQYRGAYICCQSQSIPWPCRRWLWPLSDPLLWQLRPERGRRL